MVMRIRPPAGALQGAPQIVGTIGDGRGGEVENGDEAGGQERSKEERDKERWARLKRLKQVFRVRRKPKGGEGEKTKDRGK